MKKAALRTYVDPAIRERFVAIAAEGGISESALLARAVEQVVGARGDDADEPRVESKTVSVKKRRLNLRISDPEHRVLVGVARHMGMPINRFAVNALRAAVKRQPELLKAEVASLYHAVTELNAIGRNLNQIARRLNEDKVKARLYREDLKVIEQVALFARTAAKEAGDVCKAAQERWV